MPGLLDPTDADPRAKMLSALSGIAGPWTTLQQAATPGTTTNAMSGLPTPQGVAATAGQQPQSGAQQSAQPAFQPSPLMQAMYQGQQQNQNAYGTMDPAKLGLLGAAGFPLFTDPRVVQGHLAEMAQAGGEGGQAALDEFHRQLAAASRGGGSEGAGEVSGGGSGGQGQDASGQW